MPLGGKAGRGIMQSCRPELPYKKVFPSFAFLLIFSYIHEDDSVGHSKGDFNISIVINFS